MQSFQEAVDARLAAEKVLHDGFVHAYYLWKERSAQDSEWASSHPFYYNVERCERGVPGAEQHECGRLTEKAEKGELKAGYEKTAENKTGNGSADDV